VASEDVLAARRRQSSTAAASRCLQLPRTYVHAFATFGASRGARAGVTREIDASSSGSGALGHKPIDAVAHVG
jgi:hypothetical protein